MSEHHRQLLKLKGEQKTGSNVDEGLDILPEEEVKGQHLERPYLDKPVLRKVIRNAILERDEQKDLDIALEKE